MPWMITSQCRWGPVESPVVPMLPSQSPSSDFHALADGDQGHVPVTAVDAGSVVDDHAHAVDCQVAGPDDGAGGRGDDRVAVISGDVVPVVPAVGGDAVIGAPRAKDAGDFSPTTGRIQGPSQRGWSADTEMLID